LEASVAELHQMFLDFALLTEEQGELVDQIGFQIVGCDLGCDFGMLQAIEIQKSIRKKQCCIIVTCLVIIGIIVAIVIATQSAQGKRQ
jgi:t-SNARE complex subunit (syntaxin)